MRGVTAKFDLFALTGGALTIALLWNLYTLESSRC
jgi:hypothetical protein